MLLLSFVDYLKRIYRFYAFDILYFVSDLHPNLVNPSFIKFFERGAWGGNFLREKFLPQIHYYFYPASRWLSRRLFFRFRKKSAVTKKIPATERSITAFESPTVAIAVSIIIFVSTRFRLA